MLAPLFGDLRAAVTRMSRRRSFAAVAMLTLAVTIGITTAMLAIVDSLLLRPLPWPGADRLVFIRKVVERRPSPLATDLAADLGIGLQSTGTAYLDIGWNGWKALHRAAVFDRTEAFFPSTSLVVGERGDQILRTMIVSSGLLDLLGARLLHGRGFTPEEEVTDTGVVIISFNCWQARFGSRPDVIGVTVPTAAGGLLLGRTRMRTIVGVLAPDGGALDLFSDSLQPRFRRWESVDMLLPIATQFRNDPKEPEYRAYRIVARLPEGRSSEAVQRMTLAALDPIDDATIDVALEPLVTRLTQPFASAILLLFGATSLLLLVGNVSVAGLLMTEARTRRNEIAVRYALGATRAVLARQLLMEQMILLVGAVALGLAVALWLLPLMGGVVLDKLPRIETISLSPRVIFVAVVGAITVGSGVTWLPVWLLTKGVSRTSLASWGRATQRQVRWHRSIVAAEVAFAAVLLAGAGLFAETVARLVSQPIHFNSSNLAILTTQFNLDTRRTLLPIDAALERLRGVPGVAAVAASNAIPFGGELGGSSGFYAAGQPKRLPVGRTEVSPDFLEVLGLPILRGRSLSEADRPPARTVVVSESVDRQLFGGNGLHQFLSTNSEAPMQIVGVVPDIKGRHYAEDDMPRVYTVNTTSGVNATHFVVRTRLDPRGLIPRLKETIEGTAPAIVVKDAMSMEDLIGRSLADERVRLYVSWAFAGAAGFLVLLGLYGLLGRLVAERHHELAIRLALGASPGGVAWLVLRESLAAVGIGLAIGIPGALLAAGALRAYLFGISPHAPRVFVALAVVLAVVATVAALGPVRRAIRIDPIRALREQ
jgi:putative ABC transport system permease protein